MTLVLSELSQYGIAMAADTAVTMQTITTDQRGFFRVYYGATKLRPIFKLQAGVSVWGQGKIDNVDSDVWLAEFIVRNQNNYNSIRDFAILLQNELRTHIPDIDPQQHPLGTIGFHLAGFVDSEGQKLPTFWHIHNGISQALQARGITIDPRRVNANEDFPPQQIPPGVFRITRNGDFQMYALVNQQLETFFSNLRRQGFQIPHPPSLGVTPLRARAEYLRFWIKTMGDIYRLSNIFPGIGGDVTTLTISPLGIETYETR